jgi:acyl-CoA dehydrogenase
MPKVYNDIATKAAHLHGALGVSNEMPFMHMVTSSLVMGIADGPTEVHKVTLAKQVLKDYRPDNDLFPAYHIPKLREEARKRFEKELGEVRAAYAQGREKAPA